VKAEARKVRPHPGPLLQERGESTPSIDLSPNTDSRFEPPNQGAPPLPACGHPLLHSEWRRGKGRGGAPVQGEGRGEGERHSRISVAISLLLIAFFCSSYVSFAETQIIILSSNSSPPTVGMEGQLDVALPLAGLITKPGDHRAPMLLRIAHSQPHGTLTRYDLRYIGRMPGQHDLRNYLFTADGLLATNLPALNVPISGLLPNPHNGWLEEQAQHAPSLLGGYRTTLAVIVALWIVAFFVIWRSGRRARPAANTTPVQREPTFAERIRPLVERAAAGTLSPDDKATLERLLITHWQRRLNLTSANGDELIQRLREHTEAGILLRALEDWLHRPPGRGEVHVDEFLAPYKHLADPKPAEVTA